VLATNVWRVDLTEIDVTGHYLMLTGVMLLFVLMMIDCLCFERVVIIMIIIRSMTDIIITIVRISDRGFLRLYVLKGGAVELAA
jgi:uncharacterized membrane protein YfhO